ncbi:MAG: hypothetical protein U0R19_11660 [Bryobacteraceae bacterium]
MSLQIGIFNQSDIIEMCEKVKGQLQRYGVQLFSGEPSTGVQLEGSGVLVEYRREMFVFTVEHVLNSCKQQVIWLRLRDEFMRLDCRLLGAVTDETLDAGVLHIPPEFAVNYSGVQLEDADAILQPVDPTSTVYALIGYPESHTEIDDESGAITRMETPFLFAEVDPIVYSQHDVKPRNRLLLKRERKVPLHYASGGGVWQLTLRGTIRKPSVQLVATFSDAGDYFAAGARIWPHLQLAREILNAPQEPFFTA